MYFMGKKQKGCKWLQLKKKIMRFMFSFVNLRVFCMTVLNYVLLMFS